MYTQYQANRQPQYRTQYQPQQEVNQRFEQNFEQDSEDSQVGLDQVQLQGMKDDRIQFKQQITSSNQNSLNLSSTHATQNLAKESKYIQQKSAYQEVGIPRNQLPRGFQEKAIQLIRFIPSQNLFELNEEGAQFLSQLEGDIGFVVVCGKYRTGKSFLLNRLIDAQGDGFRVDPATTSCTQGVWLYTKPLYNSLNGMQIYFLDTEGSESIDRSTTHDAKIFALAILMSSYFVFNSVGCIDEQSISQLQLTTTLAKNIQVQESHIRNTQEDSTGYNNESLLGYYTPKFVWLLRDFVLEIQDRQGRKITPKEYLENALHDESTISKTQESNKKIRKALLQFFRDRDCIPMYRPVNEENDLRQLNKLPLQKLRKEFVQQLNQLRDLLIKHCPPKQMYGVNLNGRMYCEMLQNYLNVFNRGGVPNISTAWEFIVEQECIRGFDEAQALYQRSLEQNFGQDEPKKFDEIFEVLKQMRDNAFEKFHQLAGIREKNNYYDKYKSQLVEFMNQKESLAFKLNEDMHNSRNEELINNLSEDLRINIQNEVYTSENLETFFSDFNQFLSAYDDQAGGANKSENLIKFLISFHPTLIKRLVSSIKKKVDYANTKQNVEREQFAQKEQNYRDNINILEEKLAIHENKLKKLDVEKQRLEQQKLTHQQELERIQKENEIINRNMRNVQEMQNQVHQKDEEIMSLRQQIQSLQKKKNKGCCG